MALKKLMKLSERIQMAVVHDGIGLRNEYRSKGEEGAFCCFDRKMVYTE